MPDDPVLPLKLQTANPLDSDLNWDSPELCESPHQFAQFLTRLLFVDAGDFAKLSGVVRQDGTPAANDQNKIWAKTSEPTGIGVFSGGKWQVSYNIPSHTPFLWDTNRQPVPAYVSAMGSSEISGAGLTSPTDARWVWVIFSPS